MRCLVLAAVLSALAGALVPGAACRAARRRGWERDLLPRRRAALSATSALLAGTLALLLGSAAGADPVKAAQAALCLAGWLAVCAAAITDALCRAIPNAAALAAAACGAARWLIAGQPALLADAMAGAAALGAVLLALRVGLGRGSLGMGDVKLLAGVSLLAGPERSLLLVLVASLSAVLSALAGRLTGHRGRGATMAFGPFIALGTLAVLASLPNWL